MIVWLYSVISGGLLGYFLIKKKTKINIVSYETMQALRN